MWGFNSVYTLAIKQMEPLLAQLHLDKVALSQEYEITEWLVPGLVELARRAEPVGAEDVRRLGLDTALKLAEVRESVQKSTPANRHRSIFGDPEDCLCRNGRRHPKSDPPEPTIMTATGPRGATSCDFTDRVRNVFGLTV